MIKNLNQLKQSLTEGAKFQILEHFHHPWCKDQVRVVKEVKSNGIFSAVDGEPENPVSLSNDGRGYRLWWGKASDWIFNGDGSITQTWNGQNIFRFRVLEDG